VEVEPAPTLVAQIEAELGRVGTAVFRRGKGCKACKGTGFRGRTGIFELLTISNLLQGLILRRATADELRSAAKGSLESLRCDGWRKVCAGTTTAEEVVRVTQESE
jgi:type II secretory ATPase GspE/PulE/Tfp pilus assembly ATPase PilB-like protein